MPSRQHLPCVATIVGTRPEVIKMAPVVAALAQRPQALRHILVATRQHHEILDQALGAFGLQPDVDLGLVHADKPLARIAAESLDALSTTLAKLKPQLVLVQGDTTTTLAASLASFYVGIPVAHVEAGLRTFNRRNPFPEETHRRCVTSVASLHFAPTQRARENLLAEGIAEDRIVVTGNTVVDALRGFNPQTPFDDARLESIDFARTRTLLVSAHRRENHRYLPAICAALRMIVAHFPDVRIVFPLHPNPEVRLQVTRELASIERISLVPPVGYADCLRLLDRCHLVMTDSGGLQEEAPSFAKPVLVLRTTTERPELIESGGGRLAGVTTESIVRHAAAVLRSPAIYSEMRLAYNPFGDGSAATRIAAVLELDLAKSRRPAVARPPFAWPMHERSTAHSADRSLDSP